MSSVMTGAVVPTVSASSRMPLHIVFNVASGSGNGQQNQQAMQSVLQDAGREHEFFLVHDRKQITQQAARAAEAAAHSGGAVIVAGGDGTINAVAQATLHTGQPFGIVPQGTFNYTSRAHGIPLETVQATRALLDATPKRMQVGVMHHPVLAVRERDYNNLLRRHGKATAAWMGAGVDIVMGGHIHLPYIRPLHAEVQRPAHRSWVVQAGTAVSRRTRDGIPNSVNVVRFADSGPVSCAVERWDFQAASTRFERVHSVALPLTRAEQTLQPSAADASAHTADAQQPHS